MRDSAREGLCACRGGWEGGKVRGKTVCVRVCGKCGEVARMRGDAHRAPPLAPHARPPHSPPCQKEKNTTALMTMNFERGRMGRSSSWVAWYISTRQYSAHICMEC